MSRYAYDYSLIPARPTGWRAALTNAMVITTVMAVSAISGAVVTLQLLAPMTPTAVASPMAAAERAPAAKPQIVPQIAAAPPHRQVIASANERSQQPVTVGAVRSDHPITAAPPPAAAAVQPPPVISESELTFAKGYARRHGAAQGAALAQGKILVEAAVKAKPKVYARKPADDQRRIAAARAEPFGMFQRFDRPDQFDFTRHQALAFGEQRPVVRQRSYAAPLAGPYGNSPNGLFGGLF